MKYKGYEALVRFDEDDQILIGEVINSSAIIGFHSENSKDLEGEFHTCIDNYIELCAKIGEAPKKPLSGKILVRTTPKIHRLVTDSARSRGVSVNKFIEEAVIERIQA
ncbi:MAG: toxin-antitoxin system HicB family antitoxin [Gammaproteobacteria bacterium]|nr:MAG: toxin-antitoxin system HicB family antitoxin [Gammaproteobacteria bacterium]